MADLNSLYRESFLSLTEVTPEIVTGLLDLSAWQKRVRRRYSRPRLLDRRNIALLFEKPSTRTRCAAVTAASEEGAHAEYLGRGDIHLGRKESVADTARVLGRMFDGILYRGWAEPLRELARSAGVPVWNGLTEEEHPTQALADLLTIREVFGTLSGLKVVFYGDGANNVANSLMIGCVMMGMHFVCCCPPELMPEAERIERAHRLGARTGGAVEVEHDPMAAARGANVVYTDVWASMGEEDEFEQRVRLLRPYQVTMEIMRATGNVERERVMFLHCLPAFHDAETEFTRETGALEVTDAVFNAPFSRVFDEAENRVHTLKAVMAATLVEPDVLTVMRASSDAAGRKED